MKNKHRYSQQQRQDYPHPTTEQLAQLGVALHHEQAIEQAAIGAALSTTGTFQKLKRYLTKDAFLDERHQSIYAAMDALTI